MDKHEYYLSEKRDFEGGPYDVKLRYILCSSPRTGSTLLGEMLRETEFAGDPLEYFNPYYLKPAINRSKSGGNLNLLLQFLEAKRTSANGVFGIQVHWEHFVKTFDKNNAARDAFFDRHNKFVFLRRRDKFGQAFSFYRALNSKIFSSIDEDIKKAKYYNDAEKLNPVGVTQALLAMVNQDQGWLYYLENRKINYLTIYYEDLIADWDGQCRKLLNYLMPYSGDIPPMSLRQQRPEKDALLEEYRTYLGL